MKPQCETTPECLEQFARVMREFGFKRVSEALISGYVQFEGVAYASGSATFDTPEKWSFAIAKLEDRPVFLDTENLYHKETGIVSNAKFIFDNKPYMSFDRFSWTPPKRIVTLKVGDNEPVEVEKCVRIIHYGISTMIVHDTFEAAEQFRKAMKPLVKE